MGATLKHILIAAAVSVLTALANMAASYPVTGKWAAIIGAAIAAVSGLMHTAINWLQLKDVPPTV